MADPTPTVDFGVFHRTGRSTAGADEPHTPVRSGVAHRSRSGTTRWAGMARRTRSGMPQPLEAAALTSTEVATRASRRRLGLSLPISQEEALLES